MAETEDGDAVALRADEIKRLRETVDILTARHEAGLEDRDRLRNERDEARAEVERAEPRRQRASTARRGVSIRPKRASLALQ